MFDMSILYETKGFRYIRYVMRYPEERSECILKLKSLSFVLLHDTSPQLGNSVSNMT